MSKNEIDHLLRNMAVIEDLRVGALEGALRVRGDELSVDAADELRSMRRRIKDHEQAKRGILAISDTD